QVVEVGHVDELQALDLAAAFGLGLVVGAKVAVDDGGVAERPALVVDRGGVVGGVHEIVEIGDAGAGHGHQGNGDPRACDPGTEVSRQDTGIWPQATSMWSLYPVQVSLQPLLFFLEPTSQAVGRSASIWPRFCVTCRSMRVGSGFGRCSSLRGRPRLRGGGVSGAGGSSLPSLALFWTGFSRASISVASRAIVPMMRPPSARSISAAWILSGSSPRANSANAPENVASDGTCERRSQPRMRRNDLSTSRRSIRALVVGMLRTALATKARARARRSSGGRPGPRGGSGTKASRPITSSVVTTRPNASVIGSLSSRIQGNKKPWMWLQRAFIASRGSSVMSIVKAKANRLGIITAPHRTHNLNLFQSST